MPDKRYTFDALRPVSTTGQVLEAFGQKRTRHSAAAVFDFIASFATMDGREVWAKHDTGALSFPHAIEGAKALLDDTIRHDGAYHDVHGWVFTPNSFRLILHDLRSLGLIQVEEYHMHVVGSLEFHVGLAIGAPGHGQDRMTLQMSVAREQLAASLQILAPHDARMKRMLEDLED